MKSYLVVTDAITLAIESCAFLITLIVYKYHGIRFSLVDKSSLKTAQDHQLYSCLVTTFMVAANSLYATPLAYELVALSMDVIDRRQIFYTSLMCSGFLFMLTLYIVHRVRGCHFSLYARIYMYGASVVVVLNYVQLVLRGYLDINVLYDYHIYSLGVISINILTAFILLCVPIKYLVHVFAAQKKV
ncbi:hypothetical protein PA25_31930 [Pseudoalteromonas sp. A25]|uniref:hypothetical protein n=1 Tax=Pseudoalteromonas sp. A25 TaxID=116092 RepID=UPI001260EDFF|nr:hypothetical protein [Pseudoalteromonas sp. A25]BBN83208.1 hypothetical protein PA25_31930 [Pseudoalteromonas sp. A25]